MNTKTGKKAQGAIEYLLLLAAAVVVVAVVISFMIGTIGPTTSSGNTQTMDFLCKTLDTNSVDCGCYLCCENYDGNPKSDDTCKNLADQKQNSLLNRCGATGAYAWHACS